MASPRAPSPTPDSPPPNGMGSPSKRPSIRSRMSSVLRRPSRSDSPARPTIGPSRKSSRSSLTDIVTSLRRPSSDKAMAPSPVAESPAREAAAEQPPVGPSPLANATRASSETSLGAPVAPKVLTEEPESINGDATPAPEAPATEPVPSPEATSTEPAPTPEATAEPAPAPEVTVEPVPAPEADAAPAPVALVPVPVLIPMPVPVPSEPEVEYTLVEAEPPTLPEPEPAPAPEPETAPSMPIPEPSAIPNMPEERPALERVQSDATDTTVQPMLTVKLSNASLKDGAIAVVRGDGDVVTVQGTPVDVQWEDPFADLAQPSEMDMPVHILPAPEVMPMPEPQPHVHDDVNSPVVTMPLPPLHNLMGAGAAPSIPSAYDLSRAPSERTPLLPRDRTPNGPEVCGWTAYVLPDAVLYWGHCGKRVVVDADLRRAEALAAVEAAGEGNPNWELWLREEEHQSKSKSMSKKKDGKKGMGLARAWVDHKLRAVVLEEDHHSEEPPREADVEKMKEEERLGMEYRYWSYVESHPAHVTLQASTRSEALDVLTWAYTEFVLPGNRPRIAPFRPDECQELMALLKQEETQPAVQTRIIARILMRSAQARLQSKALTTPRLLGFRRALVDVAVSALCLGIPFLFMGRAHPPRFDVEGGGLIGVGLRSPGTAIVAAGASCLVAAMILSASVAFLSMPGLDEFSRTAGVVAVLFAAASVGATVVALFRYKADVERAQYYLGMAHEGLVLLTRRSIVMSLPLVMLAWATIAFVVGITMYTFRGGVPGGVFGKPFEKTAQWTIAGVLGGLLGILLTSCLLVR